MHEGWINGGFLVFERRALAHIKGDAESLELDLLPKLAGMRELAVYQHSGFWQCMDTYKDTVNLNTLWQNNQARWKIWEEMSG